MITKKSSNCLSSPMDCSPPGSSIHGIFQARVLEWDAIAFSDHPTLGLSLREEAKVTLKGTWLLRCV